jgi:N-acetylmuramoyl-L-alanine amidase
MHRRRVVLAALGCALAATSCGRPPGPTLDDAPAAAAADETTTVAPTTTTQSSRWPALALDGAAKVVVTPSGVVVPVVESLDGGWRVTTPCGEQVEVVGAEPVAAAHVVIDPGHGGTEVGAIAENGVQEAALNLSVAQEVEQILEREGMQVTLTREADYRLPIPTRADIVNALQPSLFVSIHHNGGEAATRDTPGTEVYYQVADERSRRLAGLMWEDITQTLSTYDVAWRGGSDAGAIYRKDRDGSDFYGVLRRTAGVPAVLVEAAYLSNPAEADLLARYDVQSAEAHAIAAAIRRWFLTDDPGSGFMEPLFRGYGDGGGGTFANCKDPDLS